MSWDMFERNGNIGYYLLFRALHATPQRQLRPKERQRQRKTTQ